MSESDSTCDGIFFVRDVYSLHQYNKSRSIIILPSTQCRSPLGCASSVCQFRVTESVANSTETSCRIALTQSTFCNEEHKNAFQYLNFACRCEIKALCCWWSFIWKLIFGCTNETRARQGRDDVWSNSIWPSAKFSNEWSANAHFFSGSTAETDENSSQTRQKLVSSFFRPSAEREHLFSSLIYFILIEESESENGERHGEHFARAKSLTIACFLVDKRPPALAPSLALLEQIRQIKFHPFVTVAVRRDDSEDLWP